VKTQKEYILILTMEDVKKLQSLLKDAYEYNKAQNDWQRAHDAVRLEERAKEYRLIPLNRQSRIVEDEDD